ncbi:MAG TPA: M81 family metallopeptidase [Stellaceae bacterium]|jgi:microcystin degradation protein MlrC|nr:M81 family metallopeptidase [Stellaceae bacterium]
MKRVLTGRFMHETNTFSVQKTDMALWRRRDFHRDNEIPTAFRGTRSALGATFEAADKYGWTLIHPVSANANPSGIVTDAAFEEIGGMILDAAERQGPIDGVLLHLHGAMVVDSYEDGEGELLARLRQRLGPDVPVIVTLDLHANVTQQMADHASALIGFRTYPHVDMYERAWQGADLLDRAMRGEVKPRTVIARRPMIYGLDRGRHQAGPMAELIARGERLETSGIALVVSACAGFSRANIRDVGPSVTVTVDMARGGDFAMARGLGIAEEYMDYAWATRDYQSFKLLSVAEAVARAKAGTPGDNPLVVADYTDNPGGGGYGDATAFLKALVEAGADSVAFHAICDGEAVQAGIEAGIGTATLTLGGKTDPAMGGGPLTLSGEITHLTNGRFVAYGPMGGGVERDYGPSLVFRVGGIDIILITNNGQAVDLGQFTSLGIDPARYATVCVKSMQHFRAAFEPIAREVILVDTGALCSETYTPELFDRVRRPVWPLDEIVVQIP